MQLRNTMILVLVVWLLVGWVRSQHDAAVAADDRARRANFRRRTLERLAKRGLEMAERQIVAEDLLARVKDHLTTIRSATPPSVSQRHHHHTLHNLRQIPSQLIKERPSNAEILAYSEDYRELQLSTDYTPQEEVIPEAEDEETAKRPVLREYLAEETNLPVKMRDQRGAASYPTSQRRRKSGRRRKQERKQERQNRRGQKKRKREENKRKLKGIDKKLQRLVNNTEISFHEEGEEKYIDCCPSKVTPVRKSVGKSRDHLALTIHPDYNEVHERVCLEGYEGKECIFPAKTLRAGTITRCVQEYSYSRALARPYNSSEQWKLDFIETKSGCSCQVNVTHKKKKRKRKR